MITLSIANICILVLYGLLFSIVGWGLIKPKKEDSNDELIPLTIIIPFRNEEDKYLRKRVNESMKCCLF